jgi:cytochrome c553
MVVAVAVTFSPALAPLAAAEGDATKGQALTAVCSGCHGQDGNSALANFPTLAGIGQKYLLKQLIDIKSGYRIVVEMTGLLNGYSDQDLADIAAYYDSKTTQLAGSKAINVLVNSGQEVNALELGTQVYRAGSKDAGYPACSGCHSPRGLGNDPAGYPRLSGQRSDYVEKQLKDFRAGKRVNDGDTKIMRSIAERMTDSEITAVANFIAGLH